jgi:hypothetical protein
VAEVPRRAAVRRSRAQSQRAAIRTPVRRSVEPQLAVAVAAAAPVIATDPANPFAPRASTITTRPWPRALLPGAPGAGAFNVDYGSAPAPATTFYPFQPRAVAVPVTPQQAPAAGGDDGHTPR